MRASIVVLVAVLLAGTAPALAAHHETHEHPDAEHESTQSGQGSDRSRPLEATFEPTPEPGDYTTEYYFAMTRGLANSTLITPFKVPLFLVTIPVDIVLLPAAAIAGFF